MPPRPFVVCVTSNVKGGVAATLTEKTLIVGPNGEGKSAIVNAITLALTGAADDLLGRDVVRDANMIGLMAPVNEDVRASVTLSNGVESSYHSPRNESGFGKGRLVNTFPDAVPLREVREALTGSADKARAFLLSRAAQNVAAGDVVRAIPEAHRNAYAEAVRSAGVTALSPADQLLAAIAITKQAAAAAQRRAEAAESLVQDRAGALGPEPLDADVTAAMAEANMAHAAHTAAMVAGAQQQDDNNGQARRMALEAHGRAVWNCNQAEAFVATTRAAAEQKIMQHMEAKAALADLDAALPADHARSMSATALWDAVQLITGRALTKLDTLGVDAGICPCCHSTATVAALRGGHELAASTLATLVATVAVVTRRDHAETVVGARRASAMDAVNALDQAVAHAAACDVTCAEHAAILVQYAAAPAIIAPVGLVNDVAALAAFTAANERYNALTNLRSAWSEVRANRSAGEAARSAQAEATAVYDAARAAVEGLLDSAADAFVARVNAHLPPAYRFGLQLRDGEKSVCRYGYASTDGGLLSAVSGAEWVMLTAALALACVPAGNSPTVLIPDERAFDPDTLRAAMVALTDAPAQVIFTSPIKPAGRLPAGWSLIEVGAQSTDISGGGTPPKPRGRPRKVKPEAEPEAPMLGDPEGTAEVDPFDRVLRSLAGFSTTVGECK